MPLGTPDPVINWADQNVTQERGTLHSATTRTPDTRCHRRYDFEQLQKSIPSKVLSGMLKDFEQNGIVTRTVYDMAPITVEYGLTPYGRTLEKLILELREWGLTHRQRILTE